MTHYIHIGATASDTSVPCYPTEAWENLVVAMDRGDSEAIIAITTGTRPKMVATASIRDVKPTSPQNTAEMSVDYWRKRNDPAPKEPAALASPFVTSEPDGTPVIDPNLKLQFRPRPKS